jgi:hypothetical protein
MVEHLPSNCKAMSSNLGKNKKYKDRNHTDLKISQNLEYLRQRIWDGQLTIADMIPEFRREM